MFLRATPHHALALAFLGAALACAPGGASRDTASGRATGASAEAPAVAQAVDDFGDTLPPRVPARRIVSLVPTTTELLFALGLGARLVGRTHWDAYPDSARLVPDLGNGLRPNVEAVLAARPDLVVLYASADNRAAATALRAAGIATLSIKIDRIADFERVTARLAAVTGQEARGRAIVDSVRATLARVRAATAGRPRASVYWHVWDAPLITIGRGSYLHELLDVAGGTNVFGDLRDVSPQVSFEELLRRDPDVILAAGAGERRLRGDPNWRRMRAVREHRLLAVDTALVGRPGVRLGEAAVWLARLLHPAALP